MVKIKQNHSPQIDNESAAKLLIMEDNLYPEDVSAPDPTIDQQRKEGKYPAYFTLFCSSSAPEFLLRGDPVFLPKL